MDKTADLLTLVSGGEPFLDKGVCFGSPRPCHVFMMDLIRRLSGKPDIRVLEIGSWLGASLLTWDAALAKYNDGKGALTSVDPHNPYFTPPVEATPFERQFARIMETGLAYDIFRHNTGCIKASGGFTHLRAGSKNALPQLRDGHFDVVYVDGDHRYSAAKFDLMEAQRLLADGGYLCGDDLIIQAEDCDPEFLAETREQESVRMPDTDIRFFPGVTAAVAEVLGPLPTRKGFWAVQKNGSKWDAVTFDDIEAEVPNHFPDDIRDAILKDLAE
ncbi:MAG: hypothetical protein HOC63_11305 [Rhodospirillales bacterium]|jgi:SAM-dependent methyltransferase|nr:hypothetical protein [Rhodospirillales bacterium]MBT4627263.1 hypothetical protein [Rhodospirillales bacterium]MBT5351226.1 hypothetical protein [Rhodospirillales bacterium]MBT5520063.1 hypothetical protein [Rhodospirillales bacterium]MBT6110362.1 hypothetical protein [Rhodospirillales bacterium]